MYQWLKNDNLVYFFVIYLLFLSLIIYLNNYLINVKITAYILLNLLF